MQNKILNLLVLTSLVCGYPANASSIAAINAMKSPVWLQQGGSKTELGNRSVLKIGDTLVTGDNGSAEIQLWVNAKLQLNSNSEIVIRKGVGTNGILPGYPPDLYIHHGRACVTYTAQSDAEEKFRLNLDDAMFVAIHLYGDICVYRQKNLSAIKLRAGSVELTHSVDHNTIILSEPGTEFHIEDNGSYKILLPGSAESSTLKVEMPFVVELASAKSSADVSSGIKEIPDSSTGELAVPKTETVEQEIPSTQNYAVYLFSSRSREGAKQISHKLRRAGHDTQVYETVTGSGSRFRVAATGFETRQAARDFSDSVVGTLGITGTWIAAEPETARQNMVPAYIFTVYLFSSQSEENAERINERFRTAGHDTKVFANITDSGSHYRVVATGFETRQAARDFSDSIVGTLGITGTWIGKESR